MQRALAPFVDFIATIGLVWLMGIGIVLVGLPIAAIVTALAAVFRLGAR